MDSFISLLWSIVRFILMILLSYVLDGMLFLFGGFGQAIRNVATNWTFAAINGLCLAAVIAGCWYFLAAPLPTIFIIILVMSNILSIAGIRGSTVNQDESIELSNTGPDVAPYYTIGRWVLAILLVTLIGYRLYDATAWVFVR